MTKATKAPTKAQSVKTIRAAIEKASQSVKVMRNDIQVAAVHVLIHANKYGDYSFANELVHAVAEGTNIKSLVVWFEQFGGLKIDETQPDLGFTGWSGKDHIKENFEDAKKTNWWTCKPMAAFKGYDLMAELEKLVKNAQKKASEQRKYENEGDNEKLDAMSVSPELLNALSELTKTHGGSVEPAKVTNEKRVKDVVSTEPKKQTQDPTCF